MTTSSERVDSSPSLRNELRSFLKTLQNADGGIGRTAADAPEIDGVVYIAPATKASKRCGNGVA